MKFLSLLFLLATQAIPALVGPFNPDSSATVTGIVRRVDGTRAIAEAQVALMKSDETPERAMTHSVTTDSTGRFTIKGVAGGDYRVIAQAEGYFKPADDTPGSLWVAKEISVPEGQIFSGIILEMIPGGTISGRVMRADGETIANAPVEVMQAHYVNGRVTLSEAKATATDDLGEYRLYWLPPDDYYIRARYRPSSADRSERYAPVYFPGFPDEEIAPIMTVKPTAEVSAIDFRVEMNPVEGRAISGRVTTVEGDLIDKPVIGVYVVPRGRTVTLATDASDAFKNEAPDIENGVGGRFLVRGVPKGSYDVIPLVRNEDGNLRTVRIPVEVEDKDVADLSAPLSISVELRGRVTVDGKTPASAWTNDVVLTSLDGLPGILLNPTSQAAANGEAQAVVKVNAETGEFVFPHVAPGQYAVRFASPFETPGAYLADVRQDEQSVFDRGFFVAEDRPKPLELLVRSSGGTVFGSVLDPTLVRPFARATVVLVPEDAHRRNPVLYRTTLSREDGGFTITGIAPGRYKLFAWQAVTRGAWGNAAFIRKYEDRGIPVTLEENATRSVRLQLIPR